MITNEKSIPIWEKFTLTINEATEYFGLGEKKIRKLIENYYDEGFVLQNGVKTMIKREKFENFLNNTTSI